MMLLSVFLKTESSRRHLFQYNIDLLALSPPMSFQIENSAAEADSPSLTSDYNLLRQPALTDLELTVICT